MSYKLYYNLKIINESIISTDDILPAQYKHMFIKEEQLTKYLFLNKYPNLFATSMKYQVLINNGIFGVGSSREQAVSVLLQQGIKVIIAPYFGRIFFRNSWNLGLIAIQCNIENIHHILPQDVLSLNLTQGTFTINTSQTYYFNPPSKYMQNIIKAKGILNYILKRYKYHEEI